jgi:hypothetical protein
MHTIGTYTLSKCHIVVADEGRPLLATHPLHYKGTQLHLLLIYTLHSQLHPAAATL